MDNLLLDHIKIVPKNLKGRIVTAYKFFGISLSILLKKQTVIEFADEGGEGDVDLNFNWRHNKSLWYCSYCDEWIEPESVTYEELHEDCGNPVH